MAMSVKITTLSENSANSGFIAEWGISFLIEADGWKILLDTAQSFSVAYNAGILGLDLATIDKLVLSHGHYDHTGGLSDVIGHTGAIDIIAHPDIWTAKYAVYDDFQRYIGIPFGRQDMEIMGARFHFSKEPVWLADNIVTTGEIPMETDYEVLDPHLCIKNGETMITDPLTDDLAIGIKTELGLVVVLGCGHRGMINTTRHLQNITGEERVHTIVGGTHLIAATPERMAKTSDDLKKLGIEKLGVSHCTGFSASCWLASEFPEAFFMNNSGSVVTVA